MEMTTNGDESMELLNVDINHAGYSDNKDVIKNVALSVRSLSIFLIVILYFMSFGASQQDIIPQLLLAKNI